MSRNQPIKDFLTIPQAAKALAVTREAVLMAINRGKLEAVRIGHLQLVSRKSLKAYKTTRRIGRPRKQRPRK